jgi:hypothetical protein
MGARNSFSAWWEAMGWFEKVLSMVRAAVFMRPTKTPQLRHFDAVKI